MHLPYPSSSLLPLHSCDYHHRPGSLIPYRTSSYLDTSELPVVASWYTFLTPCLVEQFPQIIIGVHISQTNNSQATWKHTGEGSYKESKLLRVVYQLATAGIH